jgi:hypothetical protein
MMVAVRTSETSVYFNETAGHHIPEGCNLHILYSLSSFYNYAEILLHLVSIVIDVTKIGRFM